MEEISSRAIVARALELRQPLEDRAECAAGLSGAHDVHIQRGETVGCVARESASERPPLSTRSTSSTMKRKLACSVSSPVIESARSSGTPR